MQIESQVIGSLSIYCCINLLTVQPFVQYKCCIMCSVKNKKKIKLIKKALNKQNKS